ncbi:MAG: hypothetical protein K940chlam7_01869 [Chlamydiae bacterium]|nr:hypothetical protein [Chlamydiota bacterium]
MVMVLIVNFLALSPFQALWVLDLVEVPAAEVSVDKLNRCEGSVVTY